jgi:hypothetical protein
MDDFNGEGNGSEFNIGGSGNGSDFNVSGSGNPAGFNIGGYGISSGYNVGNVNDYDDARRTRNLFSLSPRGSGSDAYNPYTFVPHPYSSSTIPTPSQLGMSGLNLNASSGWPHIKDYEGILRSGDQVGEVGSSRGAPPVRVPSGSGGVAVALLPPQHRCTSRVRGTRRRGTGQALHTDNNPPLLVNFASHYSLHVLPLCTLTLFLGVLLASFCHGYCDTSSCIAC